MVPYYEPEGGGLERYAHAILSRLALRGHDVRALAFTRAGLSSGKRDGVVLERVTPRWTVSNTPVDPSFSARVRAALREHRPDVVVAHTPVPFAAEMAYRGARRERVPFALTYHAGRLRAGPRALAGLAALDRWTFERAMLAGSSQLIAVSSYVRDHALARHRERVDVVPPGVDAKRFQPSGSEPGREILFVGPLARSYRWKGVDVLLDAFERVHRRLPDASLSLVGAGDRVAELTARARGLDEAVRVVGRLDEADLVRAYQRAAVVALPSTTDAESFGMVLAEANACGRPVVASRIGGIPDFVRDGENGLLARPGDPADLADKLVTLLEDPQLARRLGARGRERVVREHDWDELAQRTERILEGAATARR